MKTTALRLLSMEVIAVLAFPTTGRTCRAPRTAAISPPRIPCSRSGGAAVSSHRRCAS